MHARSRHPFTLALVTCLFLVPLLAGTALAQASYTVTIQLSASTGRSLGVLSTAPATWGSDHTTGVLAFGNYVGPQTGLTHQCRSYVWFPLTAIPRNATIDAATLELYITDWPFVSSSLMGVYRVTEDWDEGFTWSTRPAEESKPLCCTPVDATTGWQSWTVTGIVQEWVRRQSDNHGLLLAASPTPDALEGNGWACAAPGRTSGDAAHRPRLVVAFTPVSTEIPEPATVVLVGAGLAGLAGLLAVRRR